MKRVDLEVGRRVWLAQLEKQEAESLCIGRTHGRHAQDGPPQMGPVLISRSQRPVSSCGLGKIELQESAAAHGGAKKEGLSGHRRKRDAGGYFMREVHIPTLGLLGMEDLSQCEEDARSIMRFDPVATPPIDHSQARAHCRTSAVWRDPEGSVQDQGRRPVYPVLDVHTGGTWFCWALVDGGARDLCLPDLGIVAASSAAYSSDSTPASRSKT
ncbi:hypothetical protein SCUP234_12607 [Seiridium cupressi]